MVTTKRERHDYVARTPSSTVPGGGRHPESHPPLGETQTVSFLQVSEGP